MIRLILLFGTLAGIAALIIWGVDSFLVIDDLAVCAKPDALTARCAPADVIIAISGGDTPARAQEAINLYQQGWAPTILFSGAAADTSGPSNAVAMRSQALRAGVPAGSILIDEKAADTMQNASRSLALIGDGHRIILVTSPYHQHRASLEFHKIFGDSIDIVNHPTPTDHMWPSTWWLTGSGWSLALSESIKTAVVML